MEINFCLFFSPQEECETSFFHVRICDVFYNLGPVALLQI